MADETKTPPITEAIPSVVGGISGIASANAPFIYFDIVPFLGHVNGIGMITLTAQRQISTRPDGSAHTDHAVVAYLRGNIPAFLALKSAIDTILLLAQPTPQGPSN
ncbi:MAG: hypothetical protein WDN46_14110 [Methylocella sp.]